MTLTEAYSFLFADSFMAALVLPPHEELVFGTMKSFGGYNMLFVTLFAVLGSTLGMLVNYSFGRLLLLCRREEMGDSSSRFEEAAAMFRRYGIWLLPFACIPIFGTAATVASGMFKVRVGVFSSFILLGRLVYYFVFA